MPSVNKSGIICPKKIYYFGTKTGQKQDKMLGKITEEELDFYETILDPIAMAEMLFHDFDNSTSFDDEKLGDIRMGQVPLMSFEYLIDDDPKLTDKENFRLKEGAGNLWCLGGRNFGKSMTEKIDVVLSLLHNVGWEMIFTSYDDLHIQGILNWVKDAFDCHPFLKDFKTSIKQKPAYVIKTKSNASVHGINMALSSRNPGSGFFQRHTKKIWVEEASMETDEVYKKRIDSRHELGCIERVSGMTNFTKYSPVGKIFYDLSKGPWVLNLPQLINPNFGKQEKAEAIKKYGGENSIGYKVFILGKVVEEGVSVFDMQRVRKNYVEKEIKNFEISKETFHDFETILVVERPKNAEVLYVCSDIGESAPSEIIIISKVNEKYHYLYNISLYNLTDEQQYIIFKWLGETLNANFIGLDTTDGTGRAIFRRLEKVFPKENLVYCSFNMKIPVDFDKDDNGNVVYDKDGLPKHVEEYISSWSVHHLKDLLYDQKFAIPMCYKFDSQINSVIAMKSISRITYKCLAEADHMFQAFQVFSIAEWSNAFNLIKPIVKKKFCKSGV